MLILANTFDLYDDKGTKVESAVASPLTHTGLAANTKYSGWKIAYSGDTTNLVTVPDFTTLKVAVTGIAATPATVSVVAGQTAKIDVSVQPANATVNGYSLSSADETIATVDADGTIHGVKAGTVNITAVANDDNTKTAVVAVTVTAA